MSARVSVIIACLAVVPVVNAQKIYWTDSGTDKIQRANLDGSDVEDLVTGLNRPSPMALDPTAGKLYWAETLTSGSSKMRRAALDGSNIEDIFTTNDYIDGLTLDLEAGKIYWTHWFDKSNGIVRADLDGSNLEALVTTGHFTPYGIALDVGRGKMYWVLDTAGLDKIQRANLDGSNVEDLVTTGLEGPFGLALDLSAQKMYWCDFTAERIQRANLDGSNVLELVTVGIAPANIALDLDSLKMYWTDVPLNVDGSIKRANLDGSNVEDVPISGLQTPMGIALHIPPPPIPTVSQWGLLIMTCLIITVGSILLKRGRFASDRARQSDEAHPRGKTDRFSTLLVHLFVCGVCFVYGPPVAAQPGEMPVRIVEVNVDSGIVSASGPGDDVVVVFSQAVSVLEAPWVRLHFQQVELSGSREADNESFLRITSLADGAVQTLDSAALRRWRNSSPYFNGDQVLVELLAHRETGDNRVAIDKILVGIRPAGARRSTLSSSTFDICGTDDRVSSGDQRAGRLRYFSGTQTNPCTIEAWCTSFLFNDRPNAFLTAGHCCEQIHFECSFIPVVEFEIPASDSDGTLNPPSDPNDQYPLNECSVQSAFPIGNTNDWCYLRVSDNGLGQGPLDRQQDSYRLAGQVPPADETDMELTGYGFDDDPPGSTGEGNSDSGTQQTDNGPYDELDDGWIR